APERPAGDLADDHLAVDDLLDLRLRDLAQLLASPVGVEGEHHRRHRHDDQGDERDEPHGEPDEGAPQQRQQAMPPRRHQNASPRLRWKLTRLPGSGLAIPSGPAGSRRFRRTPTSTRTGPTMVL